MSDENKITRTIRIPTNLNPEAKRRAAEEKRSLEQHIIYLLEKDIRQAKRKRPKSLILSELN